LENKIKDYEASLEKDFLLQATEGSLAEIQAKNARLSEERLHSQTTLKQKSKNYEQEKKELQAKYEAEAENTKLQKSLKDIRDTCLNFGSHYVQRLKEVISSVGANIEDTTPSAEDIPNTFEHNENEVDALDEVIDGHGEFCALLASRGTVATFLRLVACTRRR
jgi:chromosome segregation ATPase